MGRWEGKTRYNLIRGLLDEAEWDSRKCPGRTLANEKADAS